MPQLIKCANCGMGLAPVANPDAVAVFKDGKPDLEKTEWNGWYHGPGIGVLCPPRKMPDGEIKSTSARAPDGVTYADYFRE